jgi:hypothetical protein
LISHHGSGFSARKREKIVNYLPEQLTFNPHNGSFIEEEEKAELPMISAEQNSSKYGKKYLNQRSSLLKDEINKK